MTVVHHGTYWVVCVLDKEEKIKQEGKLGQRATVWSVFQMWLAWINNEKTLQISRIPVLFQRIQARNPKKKKIVHISV